MEDLFPYPWNPRWSAGCSFSACADAHRICQVYFGHCHFSLSFWLPSCFGKEPTEQASPTSVAVPLGRRSNSGADQPQHHLWQYAQDVALMAVINTHPLSEFKPVHEEWLAIGLSHFGFFSSSLWRKQFELGTHVNSCSAVGLKNQYHICDTFWIMKVYNVGKW